jgi:outer membrane protein OmpA-like peptidoglycan-associated protein
MPNSTLSFVNSSSFRNTLLAKNLDPYDVPGVYTPPSGPITYEVQQSISNVIDSPDVLIADTPFAATLYPLNEYGPNGGFNTTITYNGPPLPVNSNQGEYSPTDTVLDLVNEFYIDAAYIENRYGPSGGFNDMVIVTDIQNNNKIYQPYWNPPTFVPSSYTPYSILFSDNPNGTDGSLSQDSYIAKIGAEQLNYLFQQRIAAEVFQNTVGQVNLDSLSDPFEAALIATGQEPLVYRNYQITVPENPIVAAFDLASRLASAYWPVSLIPGDYFTQQHKPGFLSQQTSNALNVINQLTGGFLGPILNTSRSASELFLANTGNGQRSVLFRNIDYNRYQPDYKNQYGGLLGIAQGLVNLAVNLINPDNGTLVGGYYVGSRNAEPSTITSPPNQIPINVFGQQDPAPVYGPSELAILYEGNNEVLNFGLAAKPLSDGGGIDGQFVWTSPKYKGNAGFKATPGGGAGSLDPEFNQVSSYYTRDESTNITFKESSILDQTQRLIDSADNVTGISRLKHVGNAMNQVSKVFHDGYKEITKGSQVLSYTDFTTGAEKGIEYCRVFTKDTPYYTYADLQKTDGITTSGRRFSNSVFDNTYNLNIAPLKNPGSTNIQMNNQGKLVAKKYMFSIENLAWRTSSRPGYTYDELPTCEKGPNGGRVMWFPPYDLKFSDQSSANWNSQSFLGRPEPIYTYKDTSRTGTLSWKIIVDHPSVMNVIVEKQLKGQSKEKLNSIIDSFFAGCVKYDIYQLGLKFNTIPTKDLYTYQEILNNPQLTKEEMEGVKQAVTKDNSGGAVSDLYKDPGSAESKKDTKDNSGAEFETAFNELAFYFFNDIPDPNTNKTVSSVPYQVTYNNYTAPSFVSNYVEKANAVFKSDLSTCKSNPSYCDTNKKVKEFYDTVIIDNFKAIDNADNGFIKKAFNLLKEKNATINLTLVGSASAPASKSYNVNLSKRRNDSVLQYLKIRGKEIGCDITPFIDSKKFILADTGYGEEITVVPKSTSGGAGTSVNCTTDIKNGSGVVTSNSQIYSVDAMACRRVKIVSKVVIPPSESKNDNDPTTTQTSTPPKTIDITVKPKTPKPTVSIEKKLKEGIGKRILRQLLSECDYFQVIEENVPMLYDSIKEKIKYFNPAFHSMTPEGLNARLTFLNQCVRPGETIPTIGPDGKPKYNDAVNTSFGAPPVLILRIGDFYNTKIIPKSVSFTYEPLLYDMNPEGIGIQPMIANVTMNFDFIGGMGLAKPVEQLQNALSFNYYANTEIYDERAVWTEDTSALDKTLMESILQNQPLETVDNVDNQAQNAFGSTIGDIVNFNRVVSGETGEISYQVIMDKMLSETTTYFSTLYNQLESIVLQTNYGVLQMANQYRDYTDGNLKLGTNDELTKIYGKALLSSTEGNTKVNLFQEVLDVCIYDVNDESNPIINELINKYVEITPDEIRVLKTNMISYLKQVYLVIPNSVQAIITDLTVKEQDYVQIIRKLDIINQKTDGKKLENGTPLVYNISGSTKVSESTKQENSSITDTYVEFTTDCSKIYKSLNDYLEVLTKKEIITDTYTGYGGFKTADDSFATDGYKQEFFILVGRNFSDKNKLEDFKKFMLTANISGNKKLVKKFENITDDLAKEFSQEIKKEEKIFSDFRKSSEYKTYIESPDDILYPVGKTRVFDYTTVPNPATETAQKKLLSDLFTTVNLEPDKTKSYMGKVKFN